MYTTTIARENNYAIGQKTLRILNQAETRTSAMREKVTSTSRARVGVLRASGYIGGEALRAVLEHPEIELAWAPVSRKRRVSS